MYKYAYPFGNELTVSKETVNLTPYTFPLNGGIWEFSEIEFFYKKVMDNKKTNINIVDIGAQTGLYTLYAKYIKNATFYSFEPYKPCFDELNKNIEINSITNVKTFNIAISDKRETKFLKVPDHKGLCTLGSKPVRFGSHDNFKVECDTLDNIFYTNNIPVDFIKCDTEGWEYYVLKGGIKTIKEYKPVIQLEYNPTNMAQCDITTQMLDNIIKDLGYTCTHKSSEEYVYEYIG